MSFFKRILLPIIMCGLLLAGAGCGGSSHRKTRPAREGPSRINLEEPSEIEKKPWELWGLGRDLNGVSIKNEQIRRGDEFVRQGDYDSALRQYGTVDLQTLSPDDQRALIARKAGAELSVGKYSAGLDTVSRYFSQSGLGADTVDGHFAVILAYGYGALGDIDQSLAWFGRAEGTVSNSPVFSNAAEEGAKLLVQAIPAQSFDAAFAKWKDDLRFGGLFQQEKLHRAAPDYAAPAIALGSGAFWAQSLQTGYLTGRFDQSGSAPQQFNIGVILPLTGPFAPLGIGTKNGMDVALDVEQEPRIHVAFKDSAGDTNAAQSAAADLVRIDKSNLIVGPLLSDAANAVRRVALQSRVAQLSLSKANVFETGEGIFRLGATSNSQMDTLLDACSQSLGMTKFALVYPENNVGLEYANAFKKYISAKGLELLYEGTYAQSDETKLGLIASELSKLPLDGVFIPDGLEQARILLSLLPEAFRDHVRPMGPATWDDPQALSQSQAIFKGAVFVSPFFLGSANSLVGRFVERYMQKFGKKPDFLSAQGFDAMTIAIGAARKTLTDGTPFELALKDVEQYDGLTGAMRVDVSGEIRRAYAVVEVRGGELRALGNEVRSGKEKEETLSEPESPPIQ